MEIEKRGTARWPTLNTVLMVEKVIEEYDGKHSKRELWKNLPKKVMWQTFCIIIDYLEEINKIKFQEGKLHHIWKKHHRGYIG